MIKSALLIGLLLTGCADYYADQYQPTSHFPPATDRMDAFQACNHQAWQEWGSTPHLAYGLGVFGAVGGAAGGVLDDAITKDTTRDMMQECMAAHGYTKG